MELAVMIKKVYMVLKWVDGESAEEVLQNLSVSEQYKLGIEAGIMLKKIHSIPIDSVVIKCEEIFLSLSSRI